MIDKTKRDTKTIDNTIANTKFVSEKYKNTIVHHLKRLCCYTLPPFRSSLLLYAPSISFINPLQQHQKLECINSFLTQHQLKSDWLK